MSDVVVLVLVVLAAIGVSTFLAWSLSVALRPARLVTEGRWQEAGVAAEHLAQSWMRVFPSVRAGAVYTRALCLHLAGKLDASLALLDTIRDARGLAHAASLLEAGNLLLAGRDTTRAARILEAVCNDASPPEDTLMLAVAKHQLGDLDEASALFARTKPTRPPRAPWPKINEPVFHYLRGLYLLKTTSGEGAARDFEAAAVSPVVTIYVERARALVPPPPNAEIDPRSSLAPQIIDE